MDYSDWAPREVRALISAGKLQGQTSGMCAGYAGQPLHFAEGTGL